MEQYIPFATIILVVIGFAIQHKIFMTPADFQKEKTDFLTYIEEHYVSNKICNSQNAHITDAINLLRGDVKQMEIKLDHMSDLISMRIKQGDKDE